MIFLNYKAIIIFLNFMHGNRITEQEAIKAREKWVQGFNDTILRIWQENITLLVHRHRTTVGFA